MSFAAADCSRSAAAFRRIAPDRRQVVPESSGSRGCGACTQLRWKPRFCCSDMPRGVQWWALSATSTLYQYHGDDGPERRAGARELQNPSVFTHAAYTPRVAAAGSMSPWSTANETPPTRSAHSSPAATRQVEAHSWLGAIISSDRQIYSFVGLTVHDARCSTSSRCHVPASSSTSRRSRICLRRRLATAPTTQLGKSSV